MTKLARLRWFAFGGLFVLLLEAAAVALLWNGSQRPPAPPARASVSQPWGALDLDEFQTNPSSGLQRSLADSVRAERPGEFDGDGVREYDLLVLSGGGSSGAYGAGLLCGWAKGSARPRFKVVTGVSTGAVQATAAFLGPDYDGVLRDIFTAHGTPDIYTTRHPLHALTRDAACDTAPRKRLIGRYMTAAALAQVALEHARGRRLFVGTTNLDTAEFVVWDMGAIAASGRPGALEHYRNILLASCSVPLLFPPVYFDVDAGGRTYSEMHADGGTHAQAFFRRFVPDFAGALRDAGVAPDQARVRLFVIQNGKGYAQRERAVVPPQSIAIVAATLKDLFRTTARAGLYRTYVLASRHGIDFNLGSIPETYESKAKEVFDREAMKRLFDLGYRQASQGYPWQKLPPGMERRKSVVSTESAAVAP